MKEKDMFYLKADKGNKFVILDEVHYYERVNGLLLKWNIVYLIQTQQSQIFIELKNSQFWQNYVSTIWTPTCKLTKCLMKNSENLPIVKENFSVEMLSI